MTKTAADEALERLTDILHILPFVEKLQKAKAIGISDKEDAGRDPKSVKFSMNEWYNIANCLQFLFCRQDEIRTALSLLSAVQGGKGGWQLIETAPKDGTEVIGIVAGVAASVCRMKFRKAKNRGDIDMWIEPVWSEEIGPTTTMKNPTHWMPVQTAESYVAPSAAEVGE